MIAPMVVSDRKVGALVARKLEIRMLTRGLKFVQSRCPCIP